jgi:hypothetical protein
MDKAVSRIAKDSHDITPSSYRCLVLLPIVSDHALFQSVG